MGVAMVVAVRESMVACGEEWCELHFGGWGVGESIVEVGEVR